VVVYDWLPGRGVSVRASRLLTAAFGVAVVIAALCAPLLGQHVIDIIAVIAGSFLGLLLGVFLIGLLMPWGNTAGATLGLVAGAVSLTIVWTATEITGWWYGAFTCVPVVVVGAAASCCFPRPRPEQLRGLAFHRSKRELTFK
jgi:Na+/proline symporter